VRRLKAADRLPRRLDSFGARTYLSGMSRVSVSAAKPATFRDWLAQAHSILRTEYKSRPSALRPKEWTRLYVRGVTAEEAG
jgi:hypothetical protein